MSIILQCKRRPHNLKFPIFAQFMANFLQSFMQFFANEWLIFCFFCCIYIFLFIYLFFFCMQKEMLIKKYTFAHFFSFFVVSLLSFFATTFYRNFSAFSEKFKFLSFMILSRMRDLLKGKNLYPDNLPK